jgi:phage gp46-like protein
MSSKAAVVGDLRPLIEVAALHGLSYNVLLRLVMTKQVRGDRQGRSWLADSGDVERWKLERADSVNT